VCLISISNLTCAKQDSWIPLIPQRISLPVFSTSFNDILSPNCSIQKTRSYSKFLFSLLSLSNPVLSIPPPKYTLNPFTSFYSPDSISIVLSLVQSPSLTILNCKNILPGSLPLHLPKQTEVVPISRSVHLLVPLFGHYIPLINTWSTLYCFLGLNSSVIFFERHSLTT
jgi:hypothetical protein